MTHFKLPLILLASGAPASLQMFEQYLRFAGHDVEIAASADLAPGLAAQMRPDVIVLEYGGDADARLLAGALKSSDTTRAIPVIAITRPASAPFALRDGCEVALNDPCYPDVLAAEIRRVIAVHRNVA
jgi:CheY-like chemotaxis protein